MKSILLTSIVLLFARHIYAQSGTCYLPNGTPIVNDPSWKPCTAAGLSTICCALGRNNPAGGELSLGYTQDECLPNGLCQNRVKQSGLESTVFFANFCTNATFSSPDCLGICASTRGTGGNTRMTPCSGRADSELWCCGADNIGCCAQGGSGAITLPRRFGAIVSSSILGTPTSIASSSVRSSAQSSPSASQTTTNTNTNAPISTPSASTSPFPTTFTSSKLSGGAIAGIAIGALAGIALLGAAIFFFLRARKYKKHATITATAPPYQTQPVALSPAQQQQQPPQYVYAGAPSSDKYASHQPNQYGGSVQGHEAVEMRQPTPPSEMPGGGGRY